MDMINEYIPQAQSMAKWYSYRYHRPYDEMLSAAYFGLTQAIAWVNEGRGAGHEGPYITVTMHRFLREALITDVAVPLELVAETLHAPAHADGDTLVAEALARLNPRERLVVSMRLLGETQAQIAATLSVSQPTVSTILEGIKRKLQ